MNDFLQSLRGGQKDKRASKTRRGFDNSNHYNSTSHYHSHGGYQSRGMGNYKRNTRSAGPPPQQMPSEDLGSLLSPETVETILTFIETATKNQELLFSTQERRIIAEERKADALEDIAGYLRYMVAPSMQEEAPTYAEEDLPKEHPHTHVAPMETENFFEEEALPEIKTKEPEPPAVKKTTPRRKIIKKAAATPKKEKIKILKRTKAQKIAAKNQIKKEGLLSREEVMKTIYDMRNDGATFDQVAKHFVKLGQPTFSGRGEWHAQTVHRLCNKRK